MYDTLELPPGTPISNPSIIECKFSGIDPKLENWKSTVFTINVNQTDVVVTKAHAIVEIVSFK